MKADRNEGAYINKPWDLFLCLTLIPPVDVAGWPQFIRNTPSKPSLMYSVTLAATAAAPSLLHVTTMACALLRFCREILLSPEKLCTTLLSSYSSLSIQPQVVTHMRDKMWRQTWREEAACPTRQKQLVLHHHVTPSAFYKMTWTLLQVTRRGYHFLRKHILSSHTVAHTGFISCPYLTRSILSYNTRR